MAKGNLTADNVSVRSNNEIAEISRGAVSRAERVQTAAGNTTTTCDDIDIITGNVEQPNEYSTDMRTSCNKAMETLSLLIK